MKNLNNAESNESTLRTLSCNKMELMIKNNLEKKKNFPKFSFGNFKK